LSPRYPRPVRRDPPQAGRFLLHPPPRPMLLDFPDRPTLEVIPPTFTDKDLVFLRAMGIILDFNRELRAPS